MTVTTRLYAICLLQKFSRIKFTIFSRAGWANSIASQKLSVSLCVCARVNQIHILPKQSPDNFSSWNLAEIYLSRETADISPTAHSPWTIPPTGSRASQPTGSLTDSPATKQLQQQLRRLFTNWWILKAVTDAKLMDTTKIISRFHR